jgi:hypothetical protein
MLVQGGKEGRGEMGEKGGGVREKELRSCRALFKS